MAIFKQIVVKNEGRSCLIMMMLPLLHDLPGELPDTSFNRVLVPTKTLQLPLIQRLFHYPGSRGLVLGLLDRAKFAAAQNDIQKTTSSRRSGKYQTCTKDFNLCKMNICETIHTSTNSSEVLAMVAVKLRPLAGKSGAEEFSIGSTDL